ncbi:MAG: ATP-binding protein [Thaumarchaeota archaeon]|nr:ATP-binding protein [Nitrososphaerota archaeon]
MQVAKAQQPSLLPIQFHPELIRELSIRLYSDRFAPVRELVSNSWDEDARHVKIFLKPASITFQDDGNGIEDPQQFVTKGDPSKRHQKHSKTLKRRLVGQKGLGSLSAFILGSKAEILTKNSHGDAYRITFDEETILREMAVACVPIDNTKGLGRGAAIKITGLRRNYAEEELREYLSLAFRLLLRKTFRIFVNGREVRPKALPKGTVYSRNVKVRDGMMRFYLIDPDTSQEREAVVHYNPVLVKSVRLEQRPHLTGYIYTDFLQVKTDRSDFIRDEAFVRFERELQRFLRSIPSSPELAGKRLLKSLRRLGKILLDAVKELDLVPNSKANLAKNDFRDYVEVKRRELSGKRLQVVKRSAEPVGRRIRVRFKNLEPRIKKRLPKRIAYGLNIECHKLSPKEPPVQRTSGNTIIINLSFPYIEQLVRLSDEGRELALIPYVARGYSDFVARDTEELIRMTDKLTAELTERYTLKRSNAI